MSVNLIDLKFSDVFLRLSSYPVFSLGERFLLNIFLKKDFITCDFLVEIENQNILNYSNKKFTALNTGSTFVKITLKENKNIFSYFGILILKDKNKLSAIERLLIKNINTNIFNKNISVYSIDRTYSYNFYQSVSNFLFEDLNILENIAPFTNKNRTNRVENKKYICIHDTADLDYSAKDWSNTVYNNFYEKRNCEYGVSYHYVVGNDGIYHNIPDNEVCFHAGDGSQNEFSLIKTNIFGTNKNPKITISKDGYYKINNKKTSILAPTNNGKILTNDNINSFGIKCENINGEYYLGNTWYSPKYNKIANCGGNLNSIGIENCLNENSSLEFTFHRLAKLVAKLMKTHNIPLKNVVPHHYFSGKDCPHTIIENDLWNYLISLIKTEYLFLKYTQNGYKLVLNTNNEILNLNGTINKTGQQIIKYSITLQYKNTKKEYTFYSFMIN